jgi:hypothetical protein
VSLCVCGTAPMYEPLSICTLLSLCYTILNTQAPLFFIVVNEFYLKFTPYGLAVDLYTLVFWHMVYACGGFLWHMAMVSAVCDV